MTQTAKPVDTDPLQSIYNIQDFHCSPAIVDGAFIFYFFISFIKFFAWPCNTARFLRPSWNDRAPPGGETSELQSIFRVLSLVSEYMDRSYHFIFKIQLCCNICFTIFFSNEMFSLKYIFQLVFLCCFYLSFKPIRCNFKFYHNWYFNLYTIIILWIILIIVRW